MYKKSQVKIKIGVSIFLILAGFFSLYFVVAGSFNPEDEREIGYESLDDNKVVPAMRR